MGITISGENNSDRILASDGVIDQLSGFNVVGVITATSFTGNLTGDVTGNLTGNVNQTSNLLLQIGGSEKFRVGSSGQLGIGGANYGTSGQVLQSAGSGAPPTWNTISGTTINSNTNNYLITGTGTANTLQGESNLTFDGSTLTADGDVLFKSTTSGREVLWDKSLNRMIHRTNSRASFGSSSQLEIWHNGSSIGYIEQVADGYLRINGNDGLHLYTKPSGGSATERLRINSSGQLLVGATGNSTGGIAEFSKSVGGGGAGCHITVQNTSSNSVNNTAGIHLKTHTGTATFFKYQANQTFIQSAAGGASELILQANGAHPLRLYTNGNERLRINSDGAFGLGGATYGSSGQVLTSAGSGSVPTWTTVSGTTINNNADNRIITGSGTANTLEGEAGLTYDGNGLTVTGIAPTIYLTETNGDPDWKLVSNAGVFKIVDHTNSADRFVINTNGTGYMVNNFQVGSTTTSPGATFHVNNSYASVKIDSDGASNDTNLFFKTNGGKENKINFGDASDDDAGQITFDHNGDHMKFKVGGSEKFRINSNGLCIGGTGSSNAITDYEEGTFTPTNATIGLQSSYSYGFYQKVGNWVTVQLGVRFNNNSSAVDIYVEGLPFTPTADQNGQYSNSFAIGYATGNHMQFALATGSGRIYFYTKNAGHQQSTHFDNDYVRLFGTYKTA